MITRKSAVLLLLVALSYGCVKETYDMERLSKRGQLSPTIVIPAFRGSVVLSDAVKQSDTVVYDPDKFVRLVFAKDSVINLEIDDFIDLADLVSFSKSYTMGELKIDNFQGTTGFSLDEVSRNFTPELRNQFVSLDDGATHPFPAFPSTSVGTKTFSAFPNFQHAVFSEGFLDISVTNTFTAPLNNINISLTNMYGAVGLFTIPAVNPGQTMTTSIDLTGRTLTNTLTASVVLTGSPGSSTPVIVDLDSRIIFTASGRGLKVTSGRVILPTQIVSDPESIDTVSFDPGDGIELEKMSVISADLDWHATYNASLNADVNIILPTVIRNGAAVTETITVRPNHIDGSLSLPNTTIAFNADPEQPYNTVPVQYTLTVNSGGNFVDFHSTDQVQLDLNLANAGIDFIKGYFGQQIENVEPETIDFGIEEYIRNISGDFLLTEPSVRINYSNSFAVPFEVLLKGVGKKGSETVDLGLSPISISYPEAPSMRDISASFEVNSDNSELPELISMPPESVVFSGSATMNPAGDATHLRNNYIFGDSRFRGDIEIELPLEFSLTNLQLTDTTDNFLQDEGVDSDFGTGDLELAKIGLNIKNGFPFNISAKMSLYDSRSRRVLSSIDVPVLLKAAQVDANGKVKLPTESASTINVTSDFLDHVNRADMIIFSFGANTPGNVKIYANYSIDFNVTLFVQTKVDLDL